MTSDRFWLLIGRKLSGEASGSELEELEEMIYDQEELKARHDAILVYWNAKNKSGNKDYRKVFNSTLQKIGLNDLAVSKEKNRNQVPLKIAAAILILFLLGFLLIQYGGLRLSDFQAVNTLTKHNDKGVRSEIILDDGTLVWLNADSQIKYPEVFKSARREVYLSGEAYFEVSENKKKPFIIHLREGSSIQVLGTSFNVKAFENDELIEASVVSGKVAFIPPVSKNKVADTILVTPDHKAVYSKRDGSVKRMETISKLDVAWKDGKLVFRDMMFYDIAKVLERSYGIQIVFENEAIKKCRFTGTFQDNTLDEVISLLARTNNYYYEYKYGKYLINGNGCN